MFHSKTTVEEGDLVIIHMTRESMQAVKMVPGQYFHNKYGRYPHDELIGLKYGSRVNSAAPYPGYVHLLRPTPELWTLSLPHRTQILYATDIAFITSELSVRVGGTVLEAGTGSGSMSHSLARTVGPKGRVHSCEYHKTRFEKAKIEFRDHGLDDIISLQHRNVCKDGFGDLKGVEAIFLDLPAPWEAIPHAIGTLREDTMTKICCFSPCLEQVLKSVTSLSQHGFSDIVTYEVLTRTHEITPPQYVPYGTVEDAIARLKTQEKHREERRIVQMRLAREKAAARKAAEDARVAAGAEPILGPSAAADVPAKAEAEDTERPAKKARTEAAITTQPAAASSSVPAGPPTPLLLSKPTAEMRGHTSYLTFARMYPLSIRKASEPALSANPVPATASVSTPVPSSAAATIREDTVETQFSSGGLDQAIGSMTEEQLQALMAPAK